MCIAYGQLYYGRKAQAKKGTILRIRIEKG